MSVHQKPTALFDSNLANDLKIAARSVHKTVSKLSPDVATSRNACLDACAQAAGFESWFAVSRLPAVEASQGLVWHMRDKGGLDRLFLEAYFKIDEDAYKLKTQMLQHLVKTNKDYVAIEESVIPFRTGTWKEVIEAIQNIVGGDKKNIWLNMASGLAQVVAYALVDLRDAGKFDLNVRSYLDLLERDSGNLDQSRLHGSAFDPPKKFLSENVRRIEDLLESPFLSPHSAAYMNGYFMELENPYQVNHSLYVAEIRKAIDAAMENAKILRNEIPFATGAAAQIVAAFEAHARRFDPRYREPQGGDVGNTIWGGRELALFAALVPAFVERREDAKKFGHYRVIDQVFNKKTGTFIDVDESEDSSFSHVFQSYLQFENLCKLALDPSLSDHARVSLTNYLRTLPGYRSDCAFDELPPETATQYGFLSMHVSQVIDDVVSTHFAKLLDKVERKLQDNADPRIGALTTMWRHTGWSSRLSEAPQTVVSASMKRAM